jgi:hypothetical protein
MGPSQRCSGITLASLVTPSPVARSRQFRALSGDHVSTSVGSATWTAMVREYRGDSPDGCRGAVSIAALRARSRARVDLPSNRLPTILDPPRLAIPPVVRT